MSTTEAKAEKQDGTASLPIPEEFVNDVIAIPSSDPDHVISLVHGIRDLGLWQHAFAMALSKYAYNVQLEPVSIGWYYPWSFLLKRKGKENEAYVLHRLNEIQNKYPDSKHSIIAHSYGTEMTARVILRVFNSYKFVFLCGGVAKREYYDRFVSKSEKTINDCSTIDHWPLIAEALNPFSYQAIGTFGMRNTIQDRFWECKHSTYMDVNSFETNILPIICGIPVNNGLKPIGKLKPIYVWFLRCSLFAVGLFVALLIIFFRLP